MKSYTNLVLIILLLLGFLYFTSELAIATRKDYANFCWMWLNGYGCFSAENKKNLSYGFAIADFALIIYTYMYIIQVEAERNPEEYETEEHLLDEN